MITKDLDRLKLYPKIVTDKELITITNNVVVVNTKNPVSTIARRFYRWGLFNDLLKS